MDPTPAVAVATCALVCLCAPMALAGDPDDFPVSVVAFSRQPVPGVDGWIFESFSSSTISPDGNVTFRATMQPAPGVGPSEPMVARIAPGGGFTLIAHPTLRPVADVPSNMQGGYLAVLGNANGYVSFSSSHAGFSGFRFVNAGTPESVAAVAVIGGPVAGLPGSTHTGSFFNLSQGGGGHTTFVGDFTGASSGRALWRWSPGVAQLEAVLVHDQPVMPANPNLRTDLVAGTVFPHLTPAGELATALRLTGPGVNSSNDRAVVRGVPGHLELLARRGDRTAPGSTMTWLATSVADLSSSGHLSLSAVVQVDGEVNTRSSLWTAAPGGAPVLRLLAGSPLPPGPGALGRVAQSVGGFQINSGGAVAGIALTGAGSPPFSNYAVLAGAEGEDLRTIIRQGVQVPGLPDGTQLTESVQFGPIHLSESGRLAFTARFIGPMLQFASGDGLWVADLNGNINLVARSEQVVELAPGDARTIASLYLPGHFGADSVGMRAWSGDDVLLFKAQFVDGSEAELTVVVPGPGSTLPFLLLGAWGARRNRQRR